MFNLFYLFTYFTLALRFNQFTTYVALILERYRLINEFINAIYLDDLERFERNGSLSVSVYYYKNGKTTENSERNNRFKLAYELKRSSNLLLEASEQLNSLYPVSLAACFISEFTEIVTGNYFYIEHAIISDSWAHYLLAILQMCPRLLNICWMTNTCERATEEV